MSSLNFKSNLSTSLRDRERESIFAESRRLAICLGRWLLIIGTHSNRNVREISAFLCDADAISLTKSDGFLSGFGVSEMKTVLTQEILACGIASQAVGNAAVV